MRTFRQTTCLILFIFVLLAGVPTLAQNEIVVVHPQFDQAVNEALVHIADMYSEQSGVQVTLEPVPPNEAYNILNANLQSGRGGIDVAILPHILGTHLAMDGAFTAYCLPGQCPECEGNNPPRWCQYAALGNFSEHIVPDFILPALCMPGQCPECESRNPPPWCGIAARGFEVDILQASAMMLVNDEVFPYGIPVWWEYQSIVANNAWFEERGLEFPSRLEEFSEIFDAFETNAYADTSYLNRGELQGNFGDASIPVYYAWPTTLARLAEVVDLADFTPLLIEDYQPEIFVTDAYAVPGGNQSLALDFIYYLSDEEAQLALYEAAHLLPANGRALEKVAEESSFTANLVTAGEKGTLAFRSQGLQSVQGGCAIGVDFSGYPDNHTFTPPNNFLISGIRFTSLGGTAPFVNATGSVNGLQFPDAGLQITPLGSVFGAMESLTGSFASNYDIILYDRFGNQINGTTIAAMNTVQPIILQGTEIAFAEFVGGGGEGVIVEICFNP